MREIDDSLPGADLIREGLRDLEAGVESVPALLVLVGAPRLRGLGYDVPDTSDFPDWRPAWSRSNVCSSSSSVSNRNSFAIRRSIRPISAAVSKLQ